MGRRVKISPCTCTNAAICAMMGQGVLSMTVTFCGHAQISQSEKIEKWLYDVTTEVVFEGNDGDNPTYTTGKVVE